MGKDPVKTIREYRKKGYIVELSVDSLRSTYAINVTAPNDIQRFTIPIEKYSIQTLHNAVRGL